MKLMPQDPDRIWKRVLIAYPFIFAAFVFVISFHLDFQQFHNDFWDNYFISSRFTGMDRQTWFNPQYPVGYCLFLKAIMGRGLPVPPAILANIFFGCLLLLTCTVIYEKILPAKHALPSLILLSLFPLNLHYWSVGGGDPGAVALFTAGAAVILWRIGKTEPQPAFPFFAAGILMGLAALFRYHALVANGMMALALVSIHPRKWKQLFILTIGICAGYSPQWFVNLATGHGLLETQFGPMNVYYLMHGINWYRVTGLHLPHSTLSIISADPALFFAKYFRAFLSFYPAWLPALFAATFERSPERKGIARVIAVWIFIYFALFSATTSGRQMLLTLPLAFLSIGMSLRIISEKFTELSLSSRSHTRFPVIAILVLLMLAFHVRRDFQMLERRSVQKDTWVSIETFLRQQGCSRAGEIFSNSFDLYFRKLPNYIPYFNGGAPRWGTYLYNETFPEFPVDSLSTFVVACRKRGVRYVILDSDCNNLSTNLGRIYSHPPVSGELTMALNVNGYKVYKVSEPAMSTD